jgi:hypothetical protein
MRKNITILLILLGLTAGMAYLWASTSAQATPEGV